MTKNKTRSETIKRGQDYFGRVSVFEGNRLLYSFSTGIARLTRSDAFRDAQNASNDLIESQSSVDLALNALLNS